MPLYLVGWCFQENQSIHGLELFRGPGVLRTDGRLPKAWCRAARDSRGNQAFLVRYRFGDIPKRLRKAREKSLALR